MAVGVIAGRAGSDGPDCDGHDRDHGQAGREVAVAGYRGDRHADLRPAYPDWVHRGAVHVDRGLVAAGRRPSLAGLAGVPVACRAVSVRHPSRMAVGPAEAVVAVCTHSHHNSPRRRDNNRHRRHNRGRYRDRRIHHSLGLCRQALR